MLPGEIPGAVIGQVANGIISKGLAVIRRQQIAPVLGILITVVERTCGICGSCGRGIGILRAA